MKASDLRPGNWFHYIGPNYPDLAGKIVEAWLVGPRSVSIHGKNGATAAFAEHNITGVPITSFYLKALGLEEKPPTEWNGNGQDWQPQTSKTVQVDFVHPRFDFFVRLETWYLRESESVSWPENHNADITIHHVEWYPKAYTCIHHPSEIHEVQNIFNLLFKEDLVPVDGFIENQDTGERFYDGTPEGSKTFPIGRTTP